MEKTVLKTIKDNKLLKRGDRVILGVSGGADSTGLLLLLHQLKKELGIEIRVIHINHQIRGSEADRDAEFVKTLCDGLKEECRIINIDVPGFAKEEGLGLEEAARIKRYEAFDGAARDWDREAGSGETKIAVAHNKEDNAETILMQLVRGTGLKGLQGMSCQRDRIIRPLLDVSRTEIEKYLADNKTSFVTDSTNLDTEYTRNKIRHEILPLLSQGVNANAVDNIINSGKIIERANYYIEKNAEEIYEKNVEERKDGCLIDLNVLKDSDRIIREYIIRLMIMHSCNKLKDITSLHIEKIEELLDLENGKRISLPYNLEAVKEYDKLKIQKKKATERLSNPSEHFSIETMDYHGEEIPNEKYIKYFDMDKISSKPVIRYPEDGDYISIADGHKNLKTYLRDEKVPLDKRDEILVLADGNHVMWVVGYRISEYYKVNNETKKIMVIKYMEA